MFKVSVAAAMMLAVSVARAEDVAAPRVAPVVPVVAPAPPVPVTLPNLNSLPSLSAPDLPLDYQRPTVTRPPPPPEDINESEGHLESCTAGGYSCRENKECCSDHCLPQAEGPNICL